MTITAGSGRLLEAVEALHGRVSGLSFPLATAGAARASEVRDQMLAQLDDYMLPRLREVDAPLLAVVGGSTGAGKSTLVNSVVGARGQCHRSPPPDHTVADPRAPS